MTTMTLFHSPLSPFVRKVMVVLHETGQLDRVTLQAVNVSPVNGDDQLNQDNPIGKIPALRTEDGTVLHDSRVICEYLDLQHVGNPLIPAKALPLAAPDPGLPGRCDHGCSGLDPLRDLPAPRRQTLGRLGPGPRREDPPQPGQPEQAHLAELASTFDIAAIGVACALGY